MRKQESEFNEQIVLAQRTLSLMRRLTSRGLVSYDDAAIFWYPAGNKVVHVFSRGWNISTVATMGMGILKSLRWKIAASEWLMLFDFKPAWRKVLVKPNHLEASNNCPQRYVHALLFHGTCAPWCDFRGWWNFLPKWFFLYCYVWNVLIRILVNSYVPRLDLNGPYLFAD